MRNKNIYTTIAYCLLLFAVVLMTAGCRTKKSTLQQNSSEKENISLIDKSQEQITEKVQEAAASSSRESVNEKQLIIECMSIKSDEATFEDKAGNKWTFKNPVMGKKSFQNTEKAKDKQSVADSSKVLETEQKRQSDLKVDSEKGFNSELKTSDERKTKIAWLYLSIGVVIVLCFMFLVNRIVNKK